MKNNTANNFFKNLITGGINLDSDDPLIIKIQFINIIGLLGMLIFTLYGVINIAIEDYFPAFMEIFTALIILIGLIHIRITKKLHVASFISIAVVYYFSIYNFLFGGFDGTGYMWVYVFPSIVFFLSGRKRGFVILMSLVSILLSIVILDLFEIIYLRYTNIEVLMFFMTFTIVSIFTVNFEILQEQSNIQLKRTLSKIKITNNQLESSLEENEKIKSELLSNLDSVEESNKSLEDQKVAMLNLVEDIELEKDMVNNQANKLRQFKEAVENSTQHIVFTDLEGKVLYANRVVEDITGFKIKEILGKTPSLWGGLMPESYYKKLWKTIKIDKKPYEGEVINKRKNGERYVAQVQIFPILDENDEVKFFVGLEQDITRQKEIDKAKNEFISVASHQLRTPLNAIRWISELLSDEKTGNLNEDQQKLLQDLRDTNIRIINLVNDLLDVSRIEDKQKFDLKKNKINMNVLIHNVINELQPIASESQIIIKNHIDKNIDIKVDDQKMFQVFKNLIDNAIKYSKQGDQVEIGVEKNLKTKVQFYIKDHGIGIKDSEKSRIFQKFFRASEAIKSNTSGSGLGLYIVKQIVEAHGGKITFESRRNSGTTFFLELPKT